MCNNNINSQINGVIEEKNVQNKQKQPHYDVFLGGTRDSQVKWRRDIAIPALKKHGITYYNPAIRERVNGCEVSDNVVNDTNTVSKPVTDREVLEWKQAMDRCNMLLFVITNDTRSMTTMILAAHYIGLGRNVVLCIQQLPESDCAINGEIVSFFKDQGINYIGLERILGFDSCMKKQQIVHFELYWSLIIYFMNEFISIWN